MKLALGVIQGDLEPEALVALRHTFELLREGDPAIAAVVSPIVELLEDAEDDGLPSVVQLDLEGCHTHELRWLSLMLREAHDLFRRPYPRAAFLALLVYRAVLRLLRDRYEAFQDRLN